MKFIYNNDAEGCILEGEKIDPTPILLGSSMIKPGTCIKYMGDGRPHRSFKMSGNYTLKYVGMLRFGRNNEYNRLLFTVHNYNYFKDNNLYYSFIFVNNEMLWLMRGQYGGMRDILLKKIEVINSPVNPIQKPQQLSFFS